MSLNWNYPSDIGGLSSDGTIKIEMSVRSMGETVNILTPTIFLPDSKHCRTDNVTMDSEFDYTRPEIGIS